MNPFDRRWHAAWRSLKLKGDDACLARLLTSHTEPGRHYHTLQHLAECLDGFDEVGHLADRPGEVALALWFHDAIYVPLAADNEARSAAWAVDALHAAGAGDAVVARVQALVLATAHHAPSEDADTNIVVDIDLAILGAPSARFAQYEQQIRAEYAAVPAAVYQVKRRAVLQHFLAQPVLYATPSLRARLEPQARANLKRATAPA